MATKKGAPAKTTAKGAKPAKPAAKAPAKKSAPQKASKPAAKPAAAKKSAAPAKKVAAKPAPKAAAKPAPKAAAKKAAAPKAAPKAVAKPAPKAAIPPKKATAKAAPAPAKKVAAAKPAPKAAEPVKKPAVVAPSKEETKSATRPLEKKATQPVKKAEPARPAKVVVPKTSTTNSVKYQPDFTRSVLDTPAANQEPQGPTMRYSDAELMEFRELINKKLDTAKKELAYLQGLITRRDESGDLDEGRYMTMEDGSMSMEREQLSQMASRQIQFIDHLEKALMRIENKTYGVCRVTGKLIDKARLRAVPHATLSIEAKQMRMR